MAAESLDEASNAIVQAVNERYGRVAATASSNQDAAATYHNVATAFGYTDAELQAIPTSANLGLSCGNPIALANLQEDEVVIDLGSGAGFDVFVAAQKIGKNGKAIGVDMNDQMLDLARRNAHNHGCTNVDFVKAAITAVPLESQIADCIISNCVVNLVPRCAKHLVFEEMYRLLRNGGRVAVSDLLARKPLPAAIRHDVAAYVGCIAGAAAVSDYERWFREAGFDEVVILDTKQDTNTYKSERSDMAESASVGLGCCGGSSADDSTSSSGYSPLADYDLNEWIGSFKIFALKP